MIRGFCILALGLTVFQGNADAQPPGNGKKDWPLFGGTLSRNMVNLIDKNIPIEWGVEEGKEKNIKWKAELGKVCYGGPVIAGGRVFVSTNNATPRDPRIKGNKSVLMCFEESSGKFLWQIAHDAPEGDIYNEVRSLGLLSTPAVDGDSIYYVLPQCIVVCADVKEGKVRWQYDMTKELKVLPFHCSNCSPLVAGNHVFVVTGNGIEEGEENGKMHNANAPSFIALTKEGKLAWQSNLPGDQVIEGQWSNPAYAVIQGKPQVIFPGGDTALYSFDPEKGKLIWEFHCRPKKAAKGGKKLIDNYFVATPVIHDDKVYIGLGVYPEHPQAPRHGFFLCIDATKTGDVSPGVSLESKDPPAKTSALLWKYGGPIVPLPANKRDRRVVMGPTISTCAIHDGLVYISEEHGYMHCLDAATGKKVWVHDLQSNVWGSPFYVDGKVFLCADKDVLIFQAGKQFKLIDTIFMDEELRGTPVVTSGVMFVATSRTLFAIARKGD